jgi:hypothetical protein
MKLLFSLFFAVGIVSAHEHEWFPPNSPTGADPVYTDVSPLSGLEIAARLQRMGGMYRTGRIKTATWRNSDGTAQASQRMETVYWDESDRVFVHSWQGRHVERTALITRYRERITGPPPKIQGVNFEN